MIEGSTIHMGDKRMANVTFSNGRQEISLTIDNGPMCQTEKLYRADMRCFDGNKDVTADVFNCDPVAIVRGDVDNMAKAMSWLQRNSWGFEAGTTK